MIVVSKDKSFVTLPFRTVAQKLYPFVPPGSNLKRRFYHDLHSHTESGPGQNG